MWFKLGSITKSNRKIFDFLYQSNYHWAYGIAFNITMNKDAAEDIAQVAFERAFQHFEEIKDVHHFVKWLKVTTTNLAIDELRKNRRYLLVDEVEEDTPSYPDYKDLEETKIKPPPCQFEAIMTTLETRRGKKRINSLSKRGLVVLCHHLVHQCQLVPGLSRQNCESREEIDGYPILYVCEYT
jgi:RNA polymerase sigma factor (sigma-70 family)